jgi:hypothetical protein
MQLTRFDRWLRQKYVYETHIYTMREVENPPRMVLGYKLPEKQGQRFRYKYVVRSNKVADELIAQLNASSMMFNTRVENRDAWYARILAPEGKSPTWWLVSFVAVLSFVASVIYGVVRVWSDPVMRQNILDAIEVLKG